MYTALTKHKASHKYIQCLIRKKKQSFKRKTKARLVNALQHRGSLRAQFWGWISGMEQAAGPGPALPRLAQEALSHITCQL